MTTKLELFAAMAPSFVGRRGLLIEFGPTIVGCKVLDVRHDDKGMRAQIVTDAGEKTTFGGQWDIVYLDEDLWQVLYANSRLLFAAEAVRRFDAGEPLDLDAYLYADRGHGPPTVMCWPARGEASCSPSTAVPGPRSS